VLSFLWVHIRVYFPETMSQNETHGLLGSPLYTSTASQTSIGRWTADWRF